MSDRNSSGNNGGSNGSGSASHRSDTSGDRSSRQLATTSDTRARRWDPFSVFNDFESEMDRVFGSRFPFMQPLFRGVGRAGRSDQGWAPSADIYEKDGNLVVKAELPGVDKDHVSVTVENGDLVIQGERKADDSVDDENYYRMERFTGSFYRRFTLPEGVDEDKISAEYKDGVLQVQIPKPSGDEDTPAQKKIEIK
jgi:HSP20 family protein